MMRWIELSEVSGRRKLRRFSICGLCGGSDSTTVVDAESREFEALVVVQGEGPRVVRLPMSKEVRAGELGH